MPAGFVPLDDQQIRAELECAPGTLQVLCLDDGLASGIAGGAGNALRIAE